MVSDADDQVWSRPLYRGLVDELLRMSRRRTHVEEGTSLDASAFAILWLLSDGRARTMRELRDELGLEQSTVNRQVNATIKRGMVERFAVEGQVSKMHRPTEKGARTFEHDAMCRARRLERVFADLAPGTPEELLVQLKAFNDAYERHSVRRSN